MDVSDSRILKLFEKYGSGTRFALVLNHLQLRLLFRIKGTVRKRNGLTLADERSS
jgi:hypothetical protein